MAAATDRLRGRPGTVRSHDGAGDRWSVTTVAPAATLATRVQAYGAYTEHTTSFTARRELASTQCVLLFNLGEPLALTGADGSSIRLQAGEGFVAGVADGTSLSRTGGSQSGVHVAVPLDTLSMVLGVPAAEIAHRVVALADVLGAPARELGERLLLAHDDEQRFQLLDVFLQSRLARAAAPDTRIGWARRQLEDSEAPRVASVARHLGWSRQHFSARFRASVGVAPDVYRQLARFERFWLMAEALPDDGLADLAARAGYHDQAHLARDVRAFSAMTPGELRRRVIPAQGGVRDD